MKQMKALEDARVLKLAGSVYGRIAASLARDCAALSDRATTRALVQSAQALRGFIPPKK